MANEERPKKPANSTMKRLSDAETEMLISFVQQRPCLWNENHVDFKNKTFRRKLWNLIGGRLHITGNEAKCKWKNLKDKFRKLRNIQEIRSSSENTPATPKWKFYNSLLFTKDILLVDLANDNYTSANHTPTVSYASGVSDDSSILPSDVNEDAEDNNFLIEKVPNRESHPTKSRSPKMKRMSTPRKCGRVTKGKMNSKDDSGKMLQLEEKGSTVSSMSQENKKGDDYHFLMSLLPYIEALDPLEKLELRFGIQKLVTDSYKKLVSKKGF